MNAFRTATDNPRYQSYTLSNYTQIPQVARLTAEQRRAIEVVGHVLPFKTNNYVVEELINWEDPDDPMFILNFPQRGMLRPDHYQQMERTLASQDRSEIERTADDIRLQLNPHPAGQLNLNVPKLRDGTRLPGMQHKYPQTVLCFPSQGQTCHAYCTFCFRWPQFVGMDGLKFAMGEAGLLVRYLEEHPEVTDVLFTGGDPMIMPARVFQRYIDPLLNAALPHLQTIRIGTKSLGFWPYKFTTDADAEATLDLFRRITGSGKHLAFMAHFSHLTELRTSAVQEAIARIRATGAVIRTQSPILRHINDSGEVWASMWREQVALGLVPYYMFAARDTGTQHYFAVPLAAASAIFRSALKKVSGIARTVRGLSMSATPGKIQVVGPAEINGEKVLVLRMLQARKDEWLHRLFIARYDEAALWIDDLVPALGEKEFFYEEDLRSLLAGRPPTGS
jgi:L-lysine 2,3-aminomutase